MYIQYQELPGFRSIFIDYIQNTDKARKYFEQNFLDEHNYEQKFQEISNSNKIHRAILPEIINEQYESLKKSKLIISNLELLKNPKTMAVVTGQQLGLYGGPLYTIYKIITAIKLSRRLKEKYDKYNFVPIFWLEGDDHDFDEVASISFFNKVNELTTITYDDGLGEEINRGSVGRIKFNDKFADVIKKLSEELKESDFKESIFTELENIYNSSKGFLSSFREFINNLFGDYGLIILDPQDRKIKKLLRPIFKKELEDYRFHADSSIQRSAQIDDDYHAQVKVKPVNLFITENKGRYLLEPTDTGFKPKNKKSRYTLDEMLSRVETNPEDFSASVLLRPICQDYILPTAFYVGGPAEIAYFGQIVPNYEFFNVPKPFIYPRASATILEKNIVNLLEKFELSVKDVFQDNENIKNEIISNVADIDINSVFDESVNEINIVIDNLKEKLFAIDPTLVDNANKSLDKIIHTLNIMRSKADSAMQRKHDTVLRQVDRIFLNLYPNGNYQERELNYISFAIKYGDDFVKWLFNELTINKFEHQILEI
jgi:bacillithiol biosynthesis cysteine-adding enzyme BshC